MSERHNVHILFFFMASLLAFVPGLVKYEWDGSSAFVGSSVVIACIAFALRTAFILFATPVLNIIHPHYGGPQSCVGCAGFDIFLGWYGDAISWVFRLKHV